MEIKLPIFSSLNIRTQKKIPMIVMLILYVFCCEASITKPVTTAARVRIFGGVFSLVLSLQVYVETLELAQKM